MREPRSIQITNPAGGVTDSRVVVDGHDMTHGITEVVFRHRAGKIPEVELHMTAYDVSRFEGKAIVRVLVNGVEFTSEDVDLLRTVAWDEASTAWPDPQMRDLADRVAALLPPRPE